MKKICDTILFATHIVTQNEQRTVLNDGAIAITNGHIVHVGSAQETRELWQGTEERDLGQCILMPGLINTHTHVAMTFLRGYADDMPLMDWLQQRIFPAEQKLTPEIVETFSLLGYAEMLRTGTTACMDMYLLEGSVLRAAEQAGIRCLGGEAIFTFPSVSGAGGQTTLEAVRTQAEQYANHARVGVLVCPHAVYTTTPQLLEQCAAFAEKYHLPLHMHVAESQHETEECQKQWGKRPLALCHEVGLLRQGTSLAHMVDVNEEELALVATQNTAISHNISSNMKLASGIAPVPSMHKHGVCVGLGTDGAASNNRLNMFTEMGRTALVHKAVHADPTVLPAQSVLDMATRNGGSIFAGLNAHKATRCAGILAPEHPADIIALAVQEPHMQPMYDIVSHLVYVATGTEVIFNMVGGEVLYDHGTFTRFDYDALLQKVTILSNNYKHI